MGHVEIIHKDGNYEFCYCFNGKWTSKYVDSYEEVRDLLDELHKKQII